MAELKDKDEQYSELLKYNKISEESKMRIVFTLRAVFVTFFVVITTVLVMHIITSYDQLTSGINNFTERNLFGLRIGGDSDLS